MLSDPTRRRYVLLGAGGGLLLGVLSAFFSPAGMKPGMIPISVKIFSSVGLTLLGGLFGWLEAKAQSR